MNPSWCSALSSLVIGGLGSFPGAVVGGIIVGEMLSLTTLYDPAYTQAAIYAAMTLVLIVRPRGLFGAHGRISSFVTRFSRVGCRKSWSP